MATTSKSQTQPTLTFPRPIFAALQPHAFLHAHLSKPAPARPSGRSPQDFRPPVVNTGGLTHCHGSAVVRCGDSAVVVGVRGEVLMAGDVAGGVREVGLKGYDGRIDSKDGDGDGDEVKEIEDLRLLVPNIELATGSTPTNLPGNPPSALAQNLAARLLRLLLTTRLIRLTDLRILYPRPPDEEGGEHTMEVVAYWTLYIDVLVISLDGNAFDAAWLALLAALKYTALPRAYWEPDFKTVLCDDDRNADRKLRLRGFPVPASFAVFEGREGEGVWVLADPDAGEEGLCRELVTVVVDLDDGRTVVRRVEKRGGGIVGRGEMRELVSLAEGRWRGFREVVGG
ncbi:ribosomal protein S5 domain 2-like protein [Patellaria atrata CBS 101060]|uniref:Ribosomal RNA-processing protein 43 n=1 Tax=Patellaria atrata CBS 101060 TaxID=1346257 RepID=A0A9P4SDZ0_9PEZI|nr:ribosomal protein S5 domain 2-like protein [Patellaria atrata CBS 101060]